MPTNDLRERFDDMFVDMNFQSLTEHKKRICWSFIEQEVTRARQVWREEIYKEWHEAWLQSANKDLTDMYPTKSTINKL